MMFQHFVLTRFNLTDPAVENKRKYNSVLSDEWLGDRLALFENYCLAPMMAQTEQNFTWLVFFDVATPEKYKTIIAEYQKAFKPFTPIFAEGMAQFLPSIETEIAARLTAPYLITSRLDNDDSLHQDYIKEIQAQFNQQDFMAIDVVDGYTLQIEPTVRFGYRSHVHNPFMSLIEKSEGFVSVWSRKRHGQWSQVKQLTSLRNKRLWMSIIHVANEANVFLGYDDVDWQDIEAFNLKGDIAHELKARRMPFSKWKGLSFKHKFKTKWKVFFKLLRRKFM